MITASRRRRRWRSRRPSPNGWPAALAPILGVDRLAGAAAGLGRQRGRPGRRTAGHHPFPPGDPPAGVGPRRAGAGPRVRRRASSTPRATSTRAFAALSSTGRLAPGESPAPSLARAPGAGADGPGARSHRTRAATAPRGGPAPPVRPPAQQAPRRRRHRAPLRHRQRLLPAGPRTVDGLLLRRLGGRDRRPGGRPGRQARPRLPQARAAAPACGCSTSAAAGAAWRCTPPASTAPTSSASRCPRSRRCWPASGWPRRDSPGRSRSASRTTGTVDDGPFDAISSVGMAEHVGRAKLPDYAAHPRGAPAARRPAAQPRHLLGRGGDHAGTTTPSSPATSSPTANWSPSATWSTR